MRIEGLFRNVTVFLLLAVFTVLTFSQSFITLNYYIQQDYIASNLCINKAIPQMHCKGKCQLIKKLQQERKNEQDNPLRKTDIKKQSYFSSLVSNDAAYSKKNFKKTYPSLLVKKTKERAGSLLRPPDLS